jgi:hypothetical protein
MHDIDSEPALHFTPYIYSTPNKVGKSITFEIHSVNLA